MKHHVDSFFSLEIQQMLIKNISVAWYQTSCFPPCSLTYASSASALVGTTLLNLQVHTNQHIATIAVSCDNCCTVRFPLHDVNADNANDIADLPKR